ncbi:phosphatase 2C-like domain-containing protein [Aspergillus coremiiformis]|uniref:Phosphatase 2C-like domain-containing protein n=1 Tax=Aspergillus coremiiformis TaxID=138285 RepID=A0A5N6YXC1_9EURO|nr:phosphatase 2C-like domain-containing protein [Aspergillus coremiiformis]
MAFSQDEVTRIISEEAYSVRVENVAGVRRYDGAQLPANSPCEDRFMHEKFASPWRDGREWMAWAVFDGHSGWQTAELLEEQLLPFVRDSLGRVVSSEESGSAELVARAIVRGFVDLDDSIIKTTLDEVSRSNESFRVRVERLAPAYAGSCALLSIYDSATGTLHVACTGDSRAVLGQKGPDGTWEVVPLSVDQTGSNKEEVDRLRREHRGEEHLVQNGRVLGLMVSRAFGDSKWKWPLEVQRDMHQDFYGPDPLWPRYDFRTPPYLTAEPVVTSTKMDPSKPSFLIMATDGMWDMLSNQQAVDLVAQWLESRVAERTSQSGPTDEPFDFGQFYGVNWKLAERTTIQDDNAAVHLLRNSLGGNDHELVSGRLGGISPSARHLRDDMTVQVVFFDGPWKTNCN